MENSSEIAGIVGSLLTLLIALSDKVVLKKLKKAQAISSETAIEFPKLNPIFRQRLKRLVRQGDIERDSSERYWINEEQRKANRRKRLRRLAIILPLILVFLLSIFLIF
ncbi:MAG: hypothetical protein DWQ05_03735 [Calditrichaeota bacterium]|nr:MAG: hypothetical protein DWQ05_03735 [Calditrichota bacterium]